MTAKRLNIHFGDAAWNQGEFFGKLQHLIVGWIKRGPSGVIGTNKPDSAATVQALLADLPKLQPCPEPDTGKIREILKERSVRIVSFPDWEKMDVAEVENGKKVGKPREKFVTVEGMMKVLK